MPLLMRLSRLLLRIVARASLPLVIGTPSGSVAQLPLLDGEPSGSTCQAGRSASTSGSPPAELRRGSGTVPGAVVDAPSPISIERREWCREREAEAEGEAAASKEGRPPEPASLPPACMAGRGMPSDTRRKTPGGKAEAFVEHRVGWDGEGGRGEGGRAGKGRAGRGGAAWHG